MIPDFPKNGTVHHFAFYAMAALILLCGCTSTTSTPATAKIAYSGKGLGSPVVVFQSGLGDGKEVWAQVITSLEEKTPTFAYDRPGYGGSLRTDQPRDPATIAHELHRTLQEAGVKPPYLLVGHSLGGLYQYIFALHYPNEVAGLVLLDPTHPDHLASMQKEAPAQAAIIKGLRHTLFLPAARAEFDAQSMGLDGSATIAPLNIPVRLLTRTRHDTLESEAFIAMVHRLEKDWSRRLGGCEILRAEKSGHYIQKDRPDLVQNAINGLLSKTASTSPLDH